MKPEDYWKRLIFSHEAPGGEYQIVQGEWEAEKVIWRREYVEEENLGQYSWPADMRSEYERLTGKPEFDPEWDGNSFVNLVEMISDEQGFNQPCAYGNLCDGHAVYCHNDGWLYSPRKCRRTWYTGGEVRDEDCPGFVANPRLGNLPN